jgi:hypothetical protein
LLHPAAGHGVRCVSGSRFPGSAAVLWPAPDHGRADRPRPRSAAPTPRRNPRQQPHHVTVAVAPLPFENDPPRPETTHRCQYTAASSARPPRRLRGLAPPSSSDAPPTVAGRRCALSFHGLCSPPRSFVDARIRAGALPGHASVSNRVDGENIRRQLARATPLRSVPQRPLAAARHRRRPEGRRIAGNAPGAVTGSDASPRESRLPSTCEHEDGRGRIPEAVGIPPAVHRGAGGSPILPSLTEARIRGAAAADRPALARSPTVSDEPVPKKSVRS